MKALPPYAHVLGLSVCGQERGIPILSMPFCADVVGRPGFVHGGALAGMLEMAAISALHTEFPDDEAPRFKPINITVDFMRGGREKETFAIGIVTRVGTRIANVEAVAWQDEREKLIASARMNILIAR